jgi:hypothetical protein
MYLGNVMRKCASEDTPTLGSILATSAGAAAGTGAGIGATAMLNDRILKDGKNLINKTSLRNLERVRSGVANRHELNAKAGRRVGRILAKLKYKRRVANNILGLATLGLGVGGGYAANELYNAD